jgi:GT2 family glycosyltransferase
LTDNLLSLSRRLEEIYDKMQKSADLNRERIEAQLAIQQQVLELAKHDVVHRLQALPNADSAEIGRLQADNARLADELQILTRRLDEHGEQIAPLRESIRQATETSWEKVRTMETLKIEIEQKVEVLSSGLLKIEGQVRDLGARTAKAQASVASQQRLIDALEERAEEQRDDLGKALQRLNEISISLASTNNSQSELERRLDHSLEHMFDRVARLETGFLSNHRAIRGIYDSRIWKTLSSAGGWLLKATGRSTEGVSLKGGAGAPLDHQALAPLHNSTAATPMVAPENTARPAPEAPDDQIEFFCDYPVHGKVTTVRRVVDIRGWAIAKSGIQEVRVEIDGGAPLIAAYGDRRQDVAKDKPDFPDAVNSGFRFQWDTTPVPEGPHSLQIISVSKSGLKHSHFCDVVVNQSALEDYERWILQNEPGPEEKRRMRDLVSFRLQPKISIATPVYKTPKDLLAQCIDSVRNQIYSNWELCLADDGSKDPELTALLESYAKLDPRIKFVTLPRNRGISGATNEALKLCTGDYFSFLDHDDELADFALWEVVYAINNNPDIDVYYSDEDKLDSYHQRYDFFFKPDWSPELFLSCNYLCHYIVIKRWIFDQVTGLNETHSGAQDYDFLLRVSNQTQKVKRIPKVLYHWRAIDGSTAKGSGEKPKASEDGLSAITEHLSRTHPGATVEEVRSCQYRVRYPVTGDPKVTILMPTGGKMELLQPACQDVLKKTTYRNFDILLIDNSRATAVKDYADGLIDSGAPVVYMDWREKPFNFSAMNNEAARRTEAPFILFLNDDMTIIEPEWMTAMLEYAQRPEIGAVGAQLLFPNDAIQHAGVVMGVYGNSGHAFRRLHGKALHYFALSDLTRDCSAVTAACLLIEKKKFFEVGCFDETNLPVAFQDVDLCLKLLEHGYRNVYTPYARLYHHESVTKSEKLPNTREDAFMKRKWAKYIIDDPYYNPNLTRAAETFDLRLDG